tara:strand:+ start:30254 stop:30445 length:192 start_codon:yes stop_codon:yes gene_type:complete
LRNALRFLGLGWYVVLCLLGGGYVGYFLDNGLGTKPFLTLLGVLVGLGLSAAGIYRMVKNLYN